VCALARVCVCVCVREIERAAVEPCGLSNTGSAQSGGCMRGRCAIWGLGGPLCLLCPPQPAARGHGGLTGYGVLLLMGPGALCCKCSRGLSAVGVAMRGALTSCSKRRAEALAMPASACRSNLRRRPAVHGLGAPTVCSALACRKGSRLRLFKGCVLLLWRCGACTACFCCGPVGPALLDCCCPAARRTC